MTGPVPDRGVTWPVSANLANMPVYAKFSPYVCRPLSFLLATNTLIIIHLLKPRAPQ